MLTAATDLTPGFADPVIDAQATFRSVLHALAHPGRIMETGDMLSAPEPLHEASAAIGLSLFDLDTPVWLDETTSVTAVESFLKFHTGCPLVKRAEQARFVIIADPANMVALEAFDAGTDEAPDQSATLIIQVARFFQGSGGVTLTGPGIKGKVSILIDGLPGDFWRQHKLLRPLFPRGLDIIFTVEHYFIGLPRTTLVEP